MSGDFVALIGENGQVNHPDKTFNGLLRPEKGSVFINGLNVAEHTTAQLSAHIGYLFKTLYCRYAKTRGGGDLLGLKVKKFPKDNIKIGCSRCSGISV